MPNRLTRLLQDKRQAGEDVLDLTISNPTRAEIDYPEEEILARLRDPRALAYEPTPHGIDPARRAVARYYLDRGRPISADDLLLTASTSEAYAFLFKVLADPGDQILIPRPSYPLFEYLAALESVEVVPYPLVYEGSWSLDLNALEKAITPRTRAVLVVHPGNPTGSYLKRGEVEDLLGICHRHELALIADEVFLDYPLVPDGERAGSLAGEDRALTFVLSGLSKVAGLPQMKLSWIWTGGPEGLARDARQRLEHVSDMFLSVGAPVQHAAEHFLELAPPIRSRISDRIRSNHGFLGEAIPFPSPARVLSAEGGWYAVVRLPAVRSSRDWTLGLLSSDNVYVHPGYLFEFPIKACLILSLLTPPAIFREGIGRLLRRMATILGIPDPT